MRATVTTYDALQHCTALTQPAGRGVAMDCARTGKGEEASPHGLVEAAVGGAMLLAMGEEALEDETVDITGARAEVRIQAGRYFEAIHVTIKMPAIDSADTRKRLFQLYPCGIQLIFGIQLGHHLWPRLTPSEGVCSTTAISTQSSWTGGWRRRFRSRVACTTLSSALPLTCRESYSQCSARGGPAA
jgi:uncharacterized OsmC-like protein